MSAQFTPGPWHTGGTFFLHNGDEHVSVWGPTPPGAQSGDQVCQYAKPEDARLIAASPELLAIAIGYEAVRKLQADYFKSRTKESLIASKQAEKVLDAQARAAIEKASSHEHPT